MIKKKAKSKTTAKKKTKKSQAKPNRETSPAEVRKEVSKLVEAKAAKIAKAVIGEAAKGQLAPARYLFEVASIYPATLNGEQATQEEDCLAKILLGCISPPAKPKEEGEDGSGQDIQPANVTAGGEETKPEGKSEDRDEAKAECGGAEPAKEEKEEAVKV